MSNFKIHPPTVVLPSVIEVDAIFLRQPTTPPPPKNSENRSVIYMNNGVLIYKGEGGTITPIANT